LQAKNIKPRLPLEKDLQLTETAMSYGGSPQTIVNIRNNPLAVQRPQSVPQQQNEKETAKTGSSPLPLKTDGKPDFEKMTPDQRLQYHLGRLTKRYG
jgi:hypothetical protein